MWSDKLKLTKQLIRSVSESGYLKPKEIQERTLARIAGGQDIIAVAPDGSGKTTSYVLGVLSRLKFGFEEAPRALVLVPDKESVDAVVEQFNLLNKNDSIRIVSLYSALSIQPQMDALADGADIVVATPDRARAIYLKLGLNLNKIMMFVVDDAERIVKNGLQLPVVELANSIIKCQHMVFTTVVHNKLNLMIDPFMNAPAVIEVDELGEAAVETYPQDLYYIPDFKSKLNLLTHLVKESETAKCIVFVSTRLTAEKVYNHVRLGMRNTVAILNPLMFESKGFSSLDDFKDQTDVRVLIIADELKFNTDLTDIAEIIHFEIPVNIEAFTNSIIKHNSNDELKCISFATDLEMADIKRIEQSIGQKMTLKDVPPGIVPLAGKKNNKAEIPGKPKTDEAMRGEAFHEKKASNRKDYNFSASKKAKMNKKKKH